MPNNDQSSKDFPKNESVMGFMRQMVREKHGAGVSQDFLNEEADRLYYKFSEEITSYFTPFIPEGKKGELDSLVSQSPDRDVLLTFLMESIDNFELKIVQMLSNFKNSYLKS